MAVNSPNSPRQRMINLIYLVFIAMLAINVSKEVIDGFELVEESLVRSTKATGSRNNLIFKDLELYHTTNPEKTEIWYNLAKDVKIKSDSLHNYVEDLKWKIVRDADGKDGDPENLKHPEDLNASNRIMFESGKDEAKKLKTSIDEYRTFISSLLTDPTKKDIIEKNLTTEPSKKAKKNNQSWEQSMFERMPMAAAVTLLTKMQNDIRSAEGEALTTLLKNVDVGDFRVNQIQARVIPQSQIVMRGGSYVADIMLTAIDSTQKPKIYINDKLLSESSDGIYKAVAGAPGTYTLKGFMEMLRGDGSISKYPFSSEYFVVEPSATVSPVLMNVLYAGIDNDIRIAVPGVASQNITASMTNGTLNRKGDGLWTARPATIGTDAVVTVTAKVGDRSQEMAKNIFRVRRLPDPAPYLEYKDDKGNSVQFKKGRISKNNLISIGELKAAIDDGILNIPFTIIRFEMLSFDESMGTAINDVSDGKNFSSSQKDRIRQMSRGKVVFIRKIIAKGPDGIERELSTLDITVN